MLQAIDLFASAGGMTVGLQKAGIKTVCAVEMDPVRIGSFIRHSPKTNVLAGDIRKIDLSTYKGKVEMVCGGPPCQPFSSGGLRKAESDDRDMIPSFFRVIKEVRPEVFLMENVPGLAVRERLGYFLSLLKEFEALNYQTSWQ